MKWLEYVKEFIKIFVIFIICTAFFYFGLRYMHNEYNNFHRYDEPDGQAVKVFNVEDANWFDRLSIFFRLGE
jgi:hypothetical protein